MWHSEADIFKDLMSLDDSGKDETYRVLYSRGRGFKNHQKPKPTNSFVDSRTGEVINLNENLESSDICHKSRGRGNALSRFLKSGNQLQKQLRLARPLGSGDDAIEAFCKRNFPAKSQESTSDSESDVGQPGISANIIYSPFNSLISNMKQKGKATRNSKLQKNALINSLISKGTCEADQGFIPINPNLMNADGGIDGDYDDDDDRDDVVDDDDDDDDDVVYDGDGGGGGGGGEGDSSLTSLSKSLGFDCSSVKSTKSKTETSGSDKDVKTKGWNVQEKYEQDTKSGSNYSSALKKSDATKLNPRISANFFSCSKETSITGEKCQGPEKRFNKKGEDLFESTSKNFTVNHDDFPPLRKSNFS